MAKEHEEIEGIRDDSCNMNQFMPMLLKVSLVLLTFYDLSEAQYSHEAERDPPDQHLCVFCAEPDAAADSKPNNLPLPQLPVPAQSNGFLFAERVCV